MHEMIVGATHNRDYKFPLMVLKNHGFVPGNIVSFEIVDGDTVAAVVENGHSSGSKFS